MWIFTVVVPIDFHATKVLMVLYVVMTQWATTTQSTSRKRKTGNILNPHYLHITQSLLQLAHRLIQWKASSTYTHIHTYTHTHIHTHRDISLGNNRYFVWIRSFCHMRHFSSTLWKAPLASTVSSRSIPDAKHVSCEPTSQMFLALLQHHPVTTNGEQQYFWGNTKWFFPPQINSVLVLTVQKTWLKKWWMAQIKDCSLKIHFIFICCNVYCSLFHSKR